MGSTCLSNLQLISVGSTCLSTYSLLLWAPPSAGCLPVFPTTAEPVRGCETPEDPGNGLSVPDGNPPPTEEVDVPWLADTPA